MQIIPLNVDSVLLFLHNSKLAYWNIATLLIRIQQHGKQQAKILD